MTRGKSTAQDGDGSSGTAAVLYDDGYFADYDMYRDTSQEFATKYWHWFFYIQGKGFPERVLAADPEYFVNYNLNLKIGPAAKSRFPKEILDEYVRCLAIR